MRNRRPLRYSFQKPTLECFDAPTFRPIDEDGAELAKSNLGVPPWEPLDLGSGRMIAGVDLIEMLELFSSSVRHGMYPPRSLLLWFADGIERWRAKEGCTTLDAELGLTSGKGSTPAYKKRLLLERSRRLMRDCVRLMSLGATQEQAAEMVAAREEAGPCCRKRRWRVSRLQSGTLVAMLQRLDARWRAVFEWDSRLLDYLPGGSAAEFLASFPIDAAPAFKQAERKSAISICSTRPRQTS